jgi:hypothetical protein
LGISISVGTLDLIECGPAAEEGQPLHDHIPLNFIAAPSTLAKDHLQNGARQRDGNATMWSSRH